MLQKIHLNMVTELLRTSTMKVVKSINNNDLFKIINKNGFSDAGTSRLKKIGLKFETLKVEFPRNSINSNIYSKMSILSVHGNLIKDQWGCCRYHYKPLLKTLKMSLSNTAIALTKGSPWISSNTKFQHLNTLSKLSVRFNSKWTLAVQHVAETISGSNGTLVWYSTNGRMEVHPLISNFDL